MTFDPSASPLIVKAWEAFDLEVREDSVISVTGNGNLSPEVNPYPEPWSGFLENWPSDFQGNTLMVFGKSDTGKSTLCTLLLNGMIKHGLAPCMIDGDVGQSDIGPPTTVGLGFTESPLIRLPECPMVDAFFFGDTSPATCIEKLMDGISIIVKRSREYSRNVIIDTCGLVTGEIGRGLALGMVEKISPDAIVLLENDGELEYMTGGSPSIQRLPALQTSKNRTERRTFRFSQFISSLEDSQERVMDLSKVTVEGFLADYSETASPEFKPTMTSNSLSLKSLADLENALLGIHNNQVFEGIGILDFVDCNGNRIEVKTNCKSDVDRLVVGNIILDDQREHRICKN